MSRRYIWKQIVRKRYCRPGTKMNLNIRTILPQGRRSLSVVKTRKQRAPLSHTVRTLVAHCAHLCCGQRTFLSRTTRTSATEVRLLSQQCCIATGTKGTSLPRMQHRNPPSPRTLYNCETITIAIPVRTIAYGLRSLIRPLRAYKPSAHRRIWLIEPTQP